MIPFRYLFALIGAMLLLLFFSFQGTIDDAHLGQHVRNAMDTGRQQEYKEWLMAQPAPGNVVVWRRK